MSPHRVQCSLVLVAGRDRALGTGQSWGAPRRHAGHWAWHAAPASGDRAGLRVRSGMQLADKTELWSPHRVQCSLVLVAGRDRALGTGQSWGAPRRHAGHCALYVHCGARIGYSVRAATSGAKTPLAPPGYCASWQVRLCRRWPAPVGLLFGVGLALPATQWRTC